MSVFRDGFFRNVDLGSETATSSLLRPEAAKTGQQAAKTAHQVAKTGQQAAKTGQQAAKSVQQAAKTGQTVVAKPTHQSNTIRSEGSLSIDSLSGSSSADILRDKHAVLTRIFALEYCYRGSQLFR
jgi:hypothetical protein